MANLDQYFFVGIHGFPLEIQTNPNEQIEDSRKQLNAIRACLFDSFPEAKSSYQDFVWIETWKDFKDAFRYLKAGTFAATLADKFDRWLATLSATGIMPQHAQLVIIAFSGGGAMFYHWLTQKKNNDCHIKAVITIAAPHQCEDGHFVFEDKPDHLMVSNDPGIPLEQIVEKLPQGQLLILLAENDSTVLMKDSEFQQIHIANKAVIQHVVPDTRHMTICLHEDTCKHILNHLQKTLA